jgi:DNA-binding CsgD family transcriptional regulator/tetratricopeptide (TPR) repeat protein
MPATAVQLLEREEELATIERLLDAARAGAGRTALVEGEAGAGKTSLLAAAADLAATRKMLVLRARGGEYERDFPFGVVRQLFEPPLREPARRAELLSGSAVLAAPVFEPGGGPIEGGAVEHGLYWLTADLAAATPLLLVVDDVQWADVASLRSLSYVCRRLDGLSAALLVAVRTGEPGTHEDLLAELRREAAGLVIAPRPLSVAATAALVVEETGAESGERLAAAYREATGGNPFLLAELARALGEAELAPGEEGVECLGRVASAGVASSIRARLSRLGEAAIEVAKAVAVLEPNAESRAVTALAGLAPEAVTDAGERLIEARLLNDDDPLSFVHPLVREAVLGEIPAPRRAALHARAARLLDGAGVEADAVAAQLLLTAPARDGWVVERLRAAAAAALARGAADAAVRYLRRALREPPADEHRLAASRELGVALLRADDAEGLEVLRTVRAATEDRTVRAELANELASSLGLRNGNEEAALMLEESLAECEDAAAGLVLSLRGWLLVQAIWGLERMPEGAMAGGDPSPDTQPGRFALQALAILYALGLAPIGRAAAIAETVSTDPEWVRVDSLAGMPAQGALLSLVLADRGDRTEGLFEIAMEGARRRGSMPGVGASHGARGLAGFLEGDLREAQVDIEIAVDVLRRFGLVTPLALWSAIAVRVLLARGEKVAAADLMDELWSGRKLVPGGPGAALLCARGELRSASGRHAEARNDFLAAAERIRWLPLANLEALPWRIGVVRCEAALGNDAEARALAAETVEVARKAGGARGIGIALRTAGTVGGGSEGIELLAEAREVLAGTRARLDHAAALVEHGAALRRANFRKDAREPLREGLELAHRCGAMPLEERARTELAATGARPRKAVFTGVESLTPSELRVARMAADGLTNREIAQGLTVTQKTVETHMRHVFQKLDLSKRTELSGVL